ncbi:MAG: hypothetical protein ACRDJW_07100 [Thermomicrobiales bacterium]
MAEPLPYPDTGHTGVGPDRGATTGTSRWQKMVGIIGIVVVLWVGNRMYDTVFGAGPGPGGPGSMQHTGGGDTPPSGVMDQSGGNTPAAPTGASSPPTAVGSTPSSIPIVSVSGIEYSFDAPETIAAGLTTIRFTNDGQDAHELQLMRLNDGVAIHQFMRAFEEGVDAALGMASMEGGVEAIGPGQTAEVTVDLPEGEYVLISLVDSPDDGVPDAFKGMVKPLTVTAAP